MTEDKVDLMSSDTKLTDAQWELFRREFKKWIDIFGLKRYEVIFTFNDDEDSNMATCYADNTGMMAWVNLHSGSCCALDATDDNVKRVALHEALELLLWDINCLLSEFMSPSVVQSKLHQIIRVIENMVFQG